MIFMIKDSKNLHVSIMTNHIQANTNSGRTPISTNCTNRFCSTLHRIALLAILVLGFGATSRANDYVITYVGSNGTVCYLARSGTSEVERVTTFDFSTCVWSCENSAGESSTLNNSTTYGWLYQTVNDTKYYLSASTSSFTLVTDPSKTTGNNSKNYTCWRTNGTYVYNYYQYRQGMSNKANSYYIGLDNPPERTTSSTNSTNATPIEVTKTNSTIVTTITIQNPTITPQENITLSSLTTQSFSASTTATETTTGKPEYYQFTISNKTRYYYNGSLSETAPSNINTTNTVTQGITYTWSFNDNTTDNGHASINSESGLLSYYESYNTNTNVTVKVTAEYSGQSKTATKTITLNALPYGDPVSISATNITIAKDVTKAADNYVITAASGYRPYKYVSASSDDTSIATITNNNGSFSITGVAEGTATITITAYKQNNSTAACSTTFTVTVIAPESGVSGTKVTLNDLEDHTWSYYSDASLPQQLRSLNPADVTITYLGNGKMYTSTTDVPSGSLSDVSSVQLSYNETANTFVYYKTLERIDGSSSNNPTGRCTYTTIPNPFSKRPTFSLSGTTYYTGFYKWRLKSFSGGSIYTVATNGEPLGIGATVDADQEIYFAPSDEYGMQVEFEAIWARAFYTTNTSTLSTYATGKNAFERNFNIVTSSQTASSIQKSYPLTISSRYPDGSNGGGSVSGGFSAAADTKFEYVSITGNPTWSANGKNLTIGRGCSGTITQLNGSTSTGNLSHTIRIESGTISNLHPTNKAQQTYSGTLSVKCIMGCDYDRAKGDNDKLSIAPTNTLIEGGGATNTFSSSSNRNNLTYDWVVKSGKIQASTSTNTADPFYLCNYISGNDANSVQYIGKRRLTIEGGEMGTVAAGIGPYGSNYSNYTVNDGSWTVMIRMKGGTVNGSIYGAGVYTGASGDRHFILTGGTVKGWIAGGCNGTKTDGGVLYGDTYIYVGGKAKCDSGNTETTVGSSRGGFVFGAGSGIQGGTTVGQVNNSCVAIADEAQIERGVYGGGNYGFVATGTGHKSDIYLLGGTVSGSVFGGSNQQQGQIVNITMKGGTITGGVFGGSNSSGTVAGPVTMNVSGGTIQGGLFGGGNGTTSNACNITGATSLTISGGNISGGVFGGGNTRSTIGNGVTITMTGGTISGGLFGGGNGFNNDNCNCSITGTTSLTISGGTINGGVYGGGNTYSTISQGTTLLITGGRINGKIFGGGNGLTNRNCSIGGGTSITYSGATTTEGIYGGGNTYSTISGDATLAINSGNIGLDADNLGNIHGGGFGNLTRVLGSITLSIGTVGNTGPTIYGDVYGGSAQGKTNGQSSLTSGKTTSVTFNSGTLNGSLYGGGLGNSTYAADVYGPVTVTVNGGTVKSTSASGSGAIYGCNNINGAPQSTVAVIINKTDPKPGDGLYAIDAVYGGGNMAPYGNTPTVTINNCDNSIEYVYGGGNAASVGGTSVTVNGGNVIGNIFGGGNGSTNAADVNGNAETNIYGGTIINAFGGSNTNGLITGSIKITVNETNTSCPVDITNLYGGGNLALYNGNTTVSIQKGTIGNAYGGGLGSSAVVGGNTTLTMTGGTATYLFGGGSEADVKGSVTVNMQGGTVTQDIYGGGALANTNIGNATNYGAANETITSTSTKTTTVNLTGGTIGNAYGGGLGNENIEALVYGNVELNLNKNVADNAKGCIVNNAIFGCNNINGTPLGSVTVHVYATQNASNTYNNILTKPAKNQDHTLNNGLHDVKAVYGGGNMAAYKPNNSNTPTHVIIDGCGKTSIEYVYGGGNAAPVPATQVDINGSYQLANVFGGGNGKDALPDGTPNPGADVGIYEVDETTWNSAGSLQYTDPGNEKGNKKYILYGNPEANGSVIGTTQVYILGGVISQVFGGSNTKGDIVKEAKVILGDENLSYCEFQVGGVYGGSNEAYMSGSAGITMNCIEGMDEIYGGSKKADITKDIVLTINGGKYGKVFGGNNISGRVMGSITINIEQTGCLPIEIGELYGGGNLAPYSIYGYNGTETGDDGIVRPIPNRTPQQGVTPYDDPKINIVSCKSIETIYGGGFEALMVGNPEININMVRGWVNGHYDAVNDQDPNKTYESIQNLNYMGTIGTVFGGGNQADVVGETTVNIGTSSNVTVHDVTKGVYTTITNNNARTDIANPGFANNDPNETTKNLTITVQGANITGNVYGGGNHAAVTGGTNIQVGKE